MQRLNYHSVSVYVIDENVIFKGVLKIRLNVSISITFYIICANTFEIDFVYSYSPPTLSQYPKNCGYMYSRAYSFL